MHAIAIRFSWANTFVAASRLCSCAQTTLPYAQKGRRAAGANMAVGWGRAPAPLAAVKGGPQTQERASPGSPPSPPAPASGGPAPRHTQSVKTSSCQIQLQVPRTTLSFMWYQKGVAVGYGVRGKLSNAATPLWTDIVHETCRICRSNEIATTQTRVNMLRNRHGGVMCIQSMNSEHTNSDHVRCVSCCTEHRYSTSRIAAYQQGSKFSE